MTWRLLGRSLPNNPGNFRLHPESLRPIASAAADRVNDPRHLPFEEKPSVWLASARRKLGSLAHRESRARSCCPSLVTTSAACRDDAGVVLIEDGLASRSGAAGLPTQGGKGGAQAGAGHNRSHLHMRPPSAPSRRHLALVELHRDGCF